MSLKKRPRGSTGTDLEVPVAKIPRKHSSFVASSAFGFPVVVAPQPSTAPPNSIGERSTGSAVPFPQAATSNAPSRLTCCSFCLKYLANDT